jgi:hypothetical protein
MSRVVLGGGSGQGGGCLEWLLKETGYEVRQLRGYTSGPCSIRSPASCSRP